MSGHDRAERASPDDPAALAGAAAIFGDRLPLAERYVALLEGSGVERGLLGPREVGRLWGRHMVNCAVLSELLPERSRVVDIGSGAGLPGLVLAIVRADVDVTVVDSRLRPTAFLAECVRELDLPVRVYRGRAEEMTASPAPDAVTARAVGSVARLVEWTLPMLRPGGELLALKGERAERELSEARPALRRRGASHAEVVRAGVGRVETPATVVRVVAPPGSQERPPGRRRHGGRPWRHQRGAAP